MSRCYSAKFAKDREKERKGIGRSIRRIVGSGELGTKAGSEPGYLDSNRSNWIAGRSG